MSATTDAPDLDVAEDDETGWDATYDDGRESADREEDRYDWPDGSGW